MKTDQTSIKIDHRHFLNSIDATLVQLTKVLSVEKAISFDEAKKLVVNILYSKANQLNEENSTFFQDLVKYLSKQMLNNPSETDKKMYKLLKAICLI